MKRRSIFAFAVVAGLFAAAVVAAQMPKPETVVQVRLEPGEAKIRRGAATRVTLVATIQPGFHVNSHKPLQDYLIPTRVELAEDAPVVLERASFPRGELKSFGFAPDEKLSVYEGTLKVPLRLRAAADAAPGTHTVRLVFHFQACNDQICLRPARREVSLDLRLQ